MIDFTGVKALTIPEGSVKKITRKSDGSLIWEKPASLKNWVHYSTEADGVTIYNGGLGYKLWWRVRSNGEESEVSEGACTGYIPVKAGDVVRMSGYDVITTNVRSAINVYDASHAVLGQISANSLTYGYGFFRSTWNSYNWGRENGVKEEKTGVYKWTVPPDATISFMRVSMNMINQNINNAIVTVNQEI